MKSENKLKKNTVETRKMELVPKDEINNWKKLFSLFGYKADCYKKTSVAPATVLRVIAEKKGLEHVVASIRKYYNENTPWQK